MDSTGMDNEGFGGKPRFEQGQHYEEIDTGQTFRPTNAYDINIVVGSKNEHDSTTVAYDNAERRSSRKSSLSSAEYDTTLF